MTRVDETTIAAILLRAPGWARIGLTVADDRLREAAADALARVIADELVMPLSEPHNPDQLALSL